jgi:NAD(P)-dependent dehydrogenase (short-subunit alcohol dehydrogenase family)
MNLAVDPLSRLDFSDVGRLDGRAAIVTGAGHGIGRAIALCFGQRGAIVVCTDLDERAAKECVERIQSAGGRAVARGCDVADARQAAAVVDEAAALTGGLRILVNNAAAFPPMCKITELEEAHWQRALAVNLTGVFNLCRAAIEPMRRAGGGSIVNVASQLGHVGAPGRAVYAATKAAVIQLSKTLALDHSADGIRVNSLSPGPVASERVIARYGGVEATDQRFAASCPLGRAGRPAEIARAALFLACDDSSFMTGADLLVDGGYTAH